MAAYFNLSGQEVDAVRLPKGTTVAGLGTSKENSWLVKDGDRCMFVPDVVFRRGYKQKFPRLVGGPKRAA